MLAGPNELLLMNRIWQNNGLSFPWLGCKACLPSCWYSPSTAFSACVLWEHSHGKEFNINWLTAIRTESLNPTVHERLIPSNNYMRDFRRWSFPNRALEWDHSPSKHLDCSLMSDPNTKGWVSYAWIPAQRKCDVTIKLLKFEVNLLYNNSLYILVSKPA